MTASEPASASPPASVGRPHVVYVTHRVPYPPDKGDRIRNYHLLRQLAERADVTLVCLADEPVSAETTAELRRLTSRLIVVPVSPRVRWARAGASLLRGRSLSEGAFYESEAARWIDEILLGGDIAAVVVSATSLCPYLPKSSTVPTFVDVVDVDSQKWFDFAAVARVPKRWLYQLEGRRVRKLESRLPQAVTAAAVVSRAEADVFESFAGRGTATVATNGVDLDYWTPTDTPTVEACAFVGALDYLPNVDAAVWFATEVWPAMREQRPTAEFWLIGRKPTPAVTRLAELPGVKLIGQVPDVRPHLARAAVAVVPMRLSRGLQNKVLEALAMGKATVAAPPALAALTAEPGKHLLAARTPAEWVEQVVGLFADPDRRATLGREGRAFVEANHHWGTCLAPFTNRIIPPRAV